MIIFTPLRTKRLTVNLEELTIESVIYLLKMPAELNEAGISAMLSYCVKPEDKPRVGQITDPRLWTVQERSMVMAHYIAHANENDPDFQIGEGRFSDYLIPVDSPKESVIVGRVEDDEWMIRPLLGAHSESIERLVTGGELSNDRAGWWFGAMAAQLYRQGDEAFNVEEGSDDDLDRWILDRVSIFKNFPQSSFLQLLTMFIDANMKMDHLLRMTFTDEGLAFSPAEGRPELPPARFPFSDAISELAKTAFGKLEGTSV